MKKICLLLLFLGFRQILSMEQRDNPNVGIDVNGNGVTIFQDLSTNFIYSNRLIGGNWDSSSTQISTTGLNSSFPIMAFDPTSGYGAAIWVSQDETTGINLIYGSVYTPPAGSTPGWSTATLITTSSNISVIPGPGYMSIAINQAGSAFSALATWTEYNSVSGNQEIASATATTSGWSTATVIPQ